MESYGLIKLGLDASNLRSQTIANNIANINTTGYKRKYVSFEETLESSTPKVEVKVDRSRSMRVDKNNVDIESEKVNQAATTLQYSALVTMANGKLSMIKSVIGGR
ncbi:flagellar basal body protein [Metaclostridioides mangenotii]|jgi:flagellar basal-body rod protein FlgB|uniref:Flagellar basal body rod protein FlgB n=1 Tax=Metaclostridioides mangenotii TaxID=1540 RepID=A0ABS4ECJ9_9FIRM|nr:flagellar basal body protein [Clostridioides mangenotii]MBP1855656.1 flagellar basal-body rod protein FlgB [Clostridioides mangenotii]